MKTATAPVATLTLAELPKLGGDLNGLIFAGVTTKPDGTHCAVAMLPEAGTKLTWKKAFAWAKEQGGELPTRPVAALIFANVTARPQSGWHWTSEEDDASCAWNCDFSYGYQSSYHKSSEGSAVAVRLIPLTA